MNVTAVRNVVAFLLLVGLYGYLAANRSDPQQPEVRTKPASPPVAEGYPVASPAPQWARCPSCPVMVLVTEQTRKAVHDGKVYFFLNETCETQWRARQAAGRSKAANN